MAQNVTKQRFIMTPLLYILGTAFALAFTLFGWSGDGIVYKLALIIGGLYFGFILTEALNYDETK
jgi:hypothetical protein